MYRLWWKYIKCVALVSINWRCVVASFLLPLLFAVGHIIYFREDTIFNTFNLKRSWDPPLTDLHLSGVIHPSSIPMTSYESLASKCQNRLAKCLLSIIACKKTNLCVSIDVTSPDELVSIIKLVGPHVCMIKVFPLPSLAVNSRPTSILYHHFPTHW